MLNRGKTGDLGEVLAGGVHHGLDAEGLALHPPHTEGTWGGRHGDAYLGKC